MVRYWRCAFADTSVSVPGICLKYFKAAKDLLPGNWSNSHHTSISRGILRGLDLGRKSAACVLVQRVTFTRSFVLGARMTSESKAL